MPVVALLSALTLLGLSVGIWVSERRYGRQRPISHRRTWEAADAAKEG